MANEIEIMNTEEQEPITCACCGCIIEGEVIDSVDGPICEDCRDREYVTCERCGQLVQVDRTESARVSWSSYITVCEDCAENEFVRCTDCEELVAPHLIEYSDVYHAICCGCSDNWCQCADCGEVLLREDACWDDDREEWYCESCRPDDDESDDELDSYGYKPAPVFGTTGDDDGTTCYVGGELTMGVELEMDKGNGVNPCVRELRDCSPRIYCKHDGSLSNGIELVTHPGTLAWHMTRLPWKELCNIGLSYGFKSHDAGTCGLHVHVGRLELGDTGVARKYTVAKIIVLMDRLWDELWRFSRRSNNHWSARTEVIHRLHDSTTVQRAVKLCETQALRDRYVALNLYNNDTIEFRLFRGTLKVDTIFATLQLVQNLCEYAMGHDVQQCLEAQWSDVQHFHEWQELNDYVADRFAGAEFPAKPQPPVLGSTELHVWKVGDQATMLWRGHIKHVTVMSVNDDVERLALYVEEGDSGFGNCRQTIADGHACQMTLDEADDFLTYTGHIDEIPYEYRCHPASLSADFRIWDRITLNDLGRRLNGGDLADAVGTIIETRDNIGDVCVAFDGFTHGHDGNGQHGHRTDCWYVATREIEHLNTPFANGDRVRIVDRALWDGVDDASNVYNHSTGVGTVYDEVGSNRIQIRWDGMRGFGNHFGDRDTWWTDTRWLVHVADDAPAMFDPAPSTYVSDTIRWEDSRTYTINTAISM